MKNISKLNFMPHQNEVLNQTMNFNRVAYYLDMGLGKTFVGAEKMWQLNNQVNLLICQKSKIADWVEHFQTFYPDYTIYNLTKKSQGLTFKNWYETKDMYDDRPMTDVVAVINYELAFRRKWLKDLKDFTLMLDESSLIQHETTERAKFILKLNPESVVLLSGTPTSGKYEALWSQLKLLGWNITKDAFWKSYVDTQWVEEGDYKRQVIVGYKHVNHLKKRLAQYGAVFMKTEEVLTLPERIEQMIYVEQSKEYKKFMKNNYLVLDTLNLCQFHDDSDYEGKDVTPRVELIGDNSLTKLLYARQLCSQWHKEKLEAFKDLVESTEDRLIVFYNFTAEYEALKKIAKSLERPVSVIRGGECDKRAYENEQNSITFIQYQAGAMGGNYQKANKIVYFSLPLGKGSCDLWEQSKKRIHRIGQTSTCLYYYLLVKGSIEEHNLEMLKMGKELTDDLFKKEG